MIDTKLDTSRVDLTLESKDSVVERASRDFLKFANENKFVNIDSMRVAFEEALINAIKHGNKYSSDRVVHVSFIASNECIKVVIENEGEGFDYTEAMIKLTQSQDNVYQGSGRGIFLISMYTDDFYYENNGKRIIMTKNR